MKLNFPIFSIIYVVAIGSMLLFGCKKPPTFSTINDFDPEGENYVPDHPNEFTISKYNNSELHLSWTVAPRSEKGITGFRILRSTSDSLHFNFFTEVSTSSSITEYQITHTLNNKVFNYLYQLQSFYIQAQDTLFSEPVFSRYDQIPGHFIQVNAYPFEENPNYTFELSKWDDPTIQFEIYTLEADSSLTLIESSQTEQENETLRYPLDIHSPPNKFLYRLTKDSFSSDYFELPDYYLSDYFPKILAITSNSNTSFSIDIDDYSNSDSVFKNRKTVFDNYQITITDSDSTVVYNSLDYSFSTPLMVNSADSLSDFTVRIKGSRGIYETDFGSFGIAFIPVKNADRTFSSFSFDGYRNMNIQINEDKKVIYLSSANSKIMKVFDYKNGRNEIAMFDNDENVVRIGKFKPCWINLAGDLLTTESTTSISAWKLNYLDLDLDIEDPESISAYDSDLPMDLFVTDFSFCSEDKIVMLQTFKTTPSKVYLTLFDPLSKSHELLFYISKIYKYSPRVLCDPINNKIYLTHQTETSFNSVSLVTYDIESKIMTSLSSTIKSPEYNLEIGNNGKNLVLSNENNYVKFDLLNNTSIVNKSFNYPIQLRSASGALTSREVCISTTDNSLYTHVECTFDKLDRKNYYRYYKSHDTSLLGASLTKNAQELFLIFKDELKIIYFEKKWALYDY